MNPSPNNTIQLRCDVSILRGQPQWVFFSTHLSQQVVISSTSDGFVVEENTNYSILRSDPGSSPSSLAGHYCCQASDGPGSLYLFAKCVQVITRPLKGELNASVHSSNFYCAPSTSVYLVMCVIGLQACSHLPYGRELLDFVNGHAKYSHAACMTLEPASVSTP